MLLFRKGEGFIMKKTSKRNKKLADILIKNKGEKEGTKEWLRGQISSRLQAEEESPEENKKKKRKLLEKLRGQGQMRKTNPML